MPDPTRSPLRVVGEGDPAPAEAEAPPPPSRGPAYGPRFDLDVVVAGLRASRDVTHNIRRGGRVRPPPSARVLGEVVDELTAALFPSHHGPGDLGYGDFDTFVRGTLNSALCLLEEEVRRCLRFTGNDELSDEARDAEALAVVRAFGASLPAVRGALVADLRAATGGAARGGAARGGAADPSLAEALLADAGVSATVSHRLAHVLDGLGAGLAARLIAAAAQRRTGIDLHPSAQVGPGFAVGRGASVCAGAVIGARVRLGPGVALAADGAGAPTVGDDADVGAGATLFGPVSVGRGARVGGGVCLAEDVPPGGRVVQAAARRADG